MSSAGAQPNRFAVLIPDDYRRPPLPAPMTAERAEQLEVQVLTLIAAGAEHAQIAAELDLSPSQASWCIAHLRLRHGAINRPHLVALAIRAGLIV